MKPAFPMSLIIEDFIHIKKGVWNHLYDKYSVSFITFAITTLFSDRRFSFCSNGCMTKFTTNKKKRQKKKKDRTENLKKRKKHNNYLTFFQNICVHECLHLTQVFDNSTLLVRS